MVRRHSTRYLCSFSFDAVIHHCQVSGLKQHKLIIFGSRGQQPESKVLAELPSFWGLGGIIRFIAFSISEAACISWLGAPSSIFKANSVAPSKVFLSDLCFYHYISFSEANPPVSYGTIVIDWVHLGNPG